MRAYGHCIRKIRNSASCFGAYPNGGVFRAYTVTNHSSDELYEDTLPCEWYEKKLPILKKLSCALKDVDVGDGRLEDISGDDLIVNDDRIKQKMHKFKSLARIFIGSPSIQQKLKEKCFKFPLFGIQSEREPLVVDTLTKVSNFLNISAQQRKLVRCTICSQVTQYRIWKGALEEVMDGLKEEIDWLNDHRPSKDTKLGHQVISSCLKFLSQSAISYEADNSTTWMRPVPAKTAMANAPPKWEDVLEMVSDLKRYLEHEKTTLYYLGKLVSMKEGLVQIRDLFMDKRIGYREIRHQEILVPKKLTKTLGHSSRCLFILLLYYLYGRVHGIEIDLCGALYEANSDGTKEKELCLSVGRILTSAEEKMLQRGVRQLDRALGIFEFVWKTAGRKEEIELQGHIWCLGAQERSFTYRGKTFFVHDLTL
ncbi:PREDICTED: uncharacterized protein LOC104810431 isoform X2 [Tarenaya hassleriana]|nr:PREDICTED: uncharacterized protein LOC104810431 isoform X2 [Tarenaya hassleriana]